MHGQNHIKYIYNKTSIKRNILTVKQNTSGVGRAKDLSAPRYRLLTFQLPNLMSPLLWSYQRISPGPRQLFIVRTYASFYGVELLAPRPKPKMEYRSLSAVRDFLFNIFAATLHIGGRSSIRNLRTCHEVVTGTHRGKQTAWKTQM